MNRKIPGWVGVMAVVIILGVWWIWMRAIDNPVDVEAMHRQQRRFTDSQIKAMHDQTDEALRNAKRSED